MGHTLAPTIATWEVEFMTDLWELSKGWVRDSESPPFDSVAAAAAAAMAIFYF